MDVLYRIFTRLTLALEIEDFVSHPQESNTVVSIKKQNIVKTVESQKEVFSCRIMSAGGNKRVDQVTFFDIWEDMNKLSAIPPQDPILKKSVISLH